MTPTTRCATPWRVTPFDQAAVSACKVSATLVLQSHRDPLPYAWLEPCLDSVRTWADRYRYDYRFIGDELFAPLTAGELEKTRDQPVIATDLARLLQIQLFLESGYTTVVWCDADLMVFNPDGLVLTDSAYALGREVWVQPASGRGLKSYVRVHNAFLVFRRGNAFLPFYLETARRLLALNSGRMPPQFIGPKLLSALHNICHCPVQENAGMLSPLVIKGLLGGAPDALQLLRRRSPAPLAAANLCASSVAGGALENAEMAALVSRLAAAASL